MQFYPQNTITNFITRLENSISLSGDWEVGLVEIQYPHTWTNLDRNDSRISYTHEVFSENGDILPGTMHRTIRLPAGYYETAQNLIDSINKFIFQVADELDIAEFPKFSYDSVTKRLNGDMNRGASVQFSPVICSMLGVAARQNPILNYDEDEDYVFEFMGANACDVNRGFSSLYIYCNVLEQVPVGDTKAPLLRIVNVSGKSGESVRTTYEKPIYVPLQQKTFDSIEINIRTDTGDPVPFESGKCIVTLHFRHCKIPYLLQ
jgi:hypothetical protein